MKPRILRFPGAGDDTGRKAAEEEIVGLGSGALPAPKAAREAESKGPRKTALDDLVRRVARIAGGGAPPEGDRGREVVARP